MWFIINRFPLPLGTSSPPSHLVFYARHLEAAKCIPWCGWYCNRFRFGNRMFCTWVIFLKYFCLWATIRYQAFDTLFIFLDLYTKPSFFNSLCSLIRPIWGKPGIFGDSSYILVTVGYRWLSIYTNLAQAETVPVCRNRQVSFPSSRVCTHCFLNYLYVPSTPYFWKLRKSNLLSPPNFSKRKVFIEHFSVHCCNDPLLFYTAYDIIGIALRSSFPLFVLRVNGLISFTFSIHSFVKISYIGNPSIFRRYSYSVVGCRARRPFWLLIPPILTWCPSLRRCLFHVLQNIKRWLF